MGYNIESEISYISPNFCINNVFHIMGSAMQYGFSDISWKGHHRLWGSCIIHAK